MLHTITISTIQTITHCAPYTIMPCTHYTPHHHTLSPSLTHCHHHHIYTTHHSSAHTTQHILSCAYVMVCVCDGDGVCVMVCVVCMWRFMSLMVCGDVGIWWCVVYDGVCVCVCVVYRMEWCVCVWLIWSTFTVSMKLFYQQVVMVSPSCFPRHCIVASL